VRLHDEGSRGGDHTAREPQLIVAVCFSTGRVGGQFQNGGASKNFSSFGGCILNFADQCNVVLFRGARGAGPEKAAAAAHKTRARSSNTVEEIFHSRSNV
jgi:hypothetical protein